MTSLVDSDKMDKISEIEVNCLARIDGPEHNSSAINMIILLYRELMKPNSI